MQAMVCSKLCRLCAQERDSFVRIYEEEGQKLNLATKIIQCLQIWLYPEDPLPKTVCIDCCAKLNQYFDFFESSSRAQLSLQLLFTKKELKKEPEPPAGQTNNSHSAPANPPQQVDEEEGEDEEEDEEDDEDNDTAEDEDESTNDADAEPPEFVECVLSDKESSTSPQKSGLSASSRRKCRVPIKRAATQGVKEKAPAKERAAPRTRAPARERLSKEHMPLKQRLELKEKAARARAEKKAREKAEKEEKEKQNEKLKVMETKMEPAAEEDDDDDDDEDEETEDDDVKDMVKIEIKEDPIKANSEENGVRAPDAEDKQDKKRLGRKKKEAGKPGEVKPPRPKAVLEGYPWQCTDCTLVLPTLQELRAHHHTVHDQLPNFKCVQCSKVYTRYRSFARHVKLHRNPKKFRCEECGKCFSQKTVLQSHSTVHTDARPHVCPQCGKAFKQFSSLYLHSKCHLPDQVKPKFPCDICHKDFATKHTLETHRKIHTGERNFICDVCGKSFIAKGSLDYHILTHSGEKPHHCAVCGKGFKTARLLGKHATLHTGIKPHQCDVCGKQFRERGALREHNRIHTGAMPYTCEFCGKNFRFKGILTVHRRQHTGERPYSCAECRREFTNWANYNKHMKRRHRNDNDPNAPPGRNSSRTYQPNPVMGVGGPGTMKMATNQATANSVAAAAVVSAAVSAASLGNVYNLSNHSVGDNSNSSSIASQNHMYGANTNVQKMANMYNSHAGGKMAAMFHSGSGHIGSAPSNAKMFHQQDSSQDSIVDRQAPNNPLMSSYHVPSYVPAGLPMSSMGYYIPPIHHMDPGMDMAHNRMNSNQ